jgi:sugar phosphate isomerase/epimerase
MQLGLDSFTLRDWKLDPYALLDEVQGLGLSGVQVGDVAAVVKPWDAGALREWRGEAQRRGLYTQVSIPTCNPHNVQSSPAQHADQVVKRLELAADAGWRELHSSLGGLTNRIGHAVPWPRQIADSLDLIRRVCPILRDRGCRINLENHGDITTFELVRMVEEIGPDVLGICLDTANVLCHAEDPVLAAQRAAPYTHMTHIKEAITWFIDTGYRRQTRPAGQGGLDWQAILRILHQHQPDLTLSIEDHPWLFDFPLFDAHWRAAHPDLNADDLARFVSFTWRCMAQLRDDQIPPVEPYEQADFKLAVKARLAAAIAHLRPMALADSATPSR